MNQLIVRGIRGAIPVLCAIAMMAAILAGCGGNPSGPEGAGAVASTSSTVNTSTGSATASGLGMIIGNVLNESNVGLGGVAVKLFVYKNGTLVASTQPATKTLSNGQYVFENLTPGLYVPSVDETDQFSSGAVPVNVQSGITYTPPDLKIITKSLNVLVPTLELSGVLVSASNKQPLSVAQVSLDSGQSTVTTATGAFYFSYVASGTRRMQVSQPGMASFTISFEVIGVTAPDASGGKYFGKSFVQVANRHYKFPEEIEVLYTLNESSILFGTVLRYAADENGILTNKLEPYPNYEFELLVMTGGGAYNRSGYIRTGADGTWKLANIPGIADNNFEWIAVATGTQVVVEAGPNENITRFNSVNAVWVGRDPVLARGYRAYGGKATIMEFVVPTFAYYLGSSGVNSAGLISPANFHSQALGIATFSWGVVASATDYHVKLTHSMDPLISVTIPMFPSLTKPPTSADAANGVTASIVVNLSAYLGNNPTYGDYYWKVGALDPITQFPRYSSETRKITLTAPVPTVTAPTSLVASDVFSVEDNIPFGWTGKGASQYRVVFESSLIKTSTAAASYSVTFNTSNTSVNTAYTLNIIPIANKIGFGRYTWRVAALDSVTGTEVFSEAKSITLQPRKKDLVPNDDADVLVQTSAYTQSFSWPFDPDATNYVFELKNPAGQIVDSTVLLPATNNRNISWAANTPTKADNYKWKVYYFYPDGSTIESLEMDVNYK